MFINVIGNYYFHYHYYGLWGVLSELLPHPFSLKHRTLSLAPSIGMDDHQKCLCLPSLSLLLLIPKTSTINQPHSLHYPPEQKQITQSSWVSCWTPSPADRLASGSFTPRTISLRMKSTGSKSLIPKSYGD